MRPIRSERRGLVAERHNQTVRSGKNRVYQNFQPTYNRSVAKRLGKPIYIYITSYSVDQVAGTKRFQPISQVERFTDSVMTSAALPRRS